MKLLFVIAAFLAITLAEKEDIEKIEDSEAVESQEQLAKSDDLSEAASAYNSYVPSQGPQWKPPQNTWTAPPKPIQSYPSNDYHNNYVPQNSYVPPQNNYVPPQNNYVPPQNNYVPPQNNYVPPQSTYRPTWTTPSYQPPSTTTQVAVIKNEMIYGDNGSYKYEYQIADGTHVGEEGYFVNSNDPNEPPSLVKKGWYSYTGADGKVYTTHYWADKTGFHAYGDHLPTPPPVPAAIQAALDQNAKEEANKPQTYPTQAPTYYPTQAPVHYPTQAPTYYPTQAPSYYPTQAPSYYPTQAPSYYPTQAPTYNPTPAPSYPSYPSSSYGKK